MSRIDVDMPDSMNLMAESDDLLDEQYDAGEMNWPQLYIGVGIAIVGVVCATAATFLRDPLDFREIETLNEYIRLNAPELISIAVMFVGIVVAGTAYHPKKED
jgi:hypothetical protein